MKRRLRSLEKTVRKDGLEEALHSGKYGAPPVPKECSGIEP